MGIRVSNLRNLCRRCADVLANVTFESVFGPTIDEVILSSFIIDVWNRFEKKVCASEYVSCSFSD